MKKVSKYLLISFFIIELFLCTAYISLTKPAFAAGLNLTSSNRGDYIEFVLDQVGPVNPTDSFKLNIYDNVSKTTTLVDLNPDQTYQWMPPSNDHRYLFRAYAYDSSGAEKNSSNQISFTPASTTTGAGTGTATGSGSGTGTGTGTTSTASSQTCSRSDFLGCVNMIIDWLRLVGGLLAAIVVVYAGYLYITAQGNDSQTKMAKELIVGVIVGILLLFTAGMILNSLTPAP